MKQLVAAGVLLVSTGVMAIDSAKKTLKDTYVVDPTCTLLVAGNDDPKSFGHEMTLTISNNANNKTSDIKFSAVSQTGFVDATLVDVDNDRKLDGTTWQDLDANRAYRVKFKGTLPQYSGNHSAQV